MVANNLGKPILFISHATYDAGLADAIKQEIETVFAKRIHVYCTSSPGAIAAGKDWLDADWIYYSDKEVAEILRVSSTDDYLTLEEADKIIYGSDE